MRDGDRPDPERNPARRKEQEERNPRHDLRRHDREVQQAPDDAVAPRPPPQGQGEQGAEEPGNQGGEDPDDKAHPEPLEQVGPLEQRAIPLDGEPGPLHREAGPVEAERDQDQHRKVEEEIDQPGKNEDRTGA